MHKFHTLYAVTLLGALVCAPAALAETACQAPLAKAAAEWNAIGFAEPMKPMQSQVILRDGHVSSGADITWLSSQLRFAAAECAEGHDAAALQRLDLVQARLNHL